MNYNSPKDKRVNTPTSYHRKTSDRKLKKLMINSTRREVQ